MSSVAKKILLIRGGVLGVLLLICLFGWYHLMTTPATEKMRDGIEKMLAQEPRRQRWLVGQHIPDGHDEV